MNKTLHENPAAATRLARMNLSKSAHTLLGICAGLSADGMLNDTEIAYLDVWLLENQDVAEMWPGSAIVQRIREIRADGVITADERQSLLELLQNVSGNEFAETGAAATSGPYAEFDADAKVEIKGHCLVLTGTFFHGSRKVCEEAT
ncbi:MAG: hypothetical protein LBI31_05015, partial [Zoogloeaceae bacterium]|nr:hypothetical protein [Zoogloeaceae bacterium]